MTDSTPAERLPAGFAPLNSLSFSFATVTVLLWGGNAVANQFAMDAMPPLFVGGVRFAMAAAFMLLWCRIERAPVWITQAGDWWRAAVLGVLLFAQIATFNLGLKASNSSHGTLLVNSYIFWVALFEVFVQRSIRLRWWQTVGLLLAAIGSGLLLLESGATPVSDGDRVTLYGDGVLALSGLILAIKIIYTKHAVRFAKAGTLMLWHDVVGAVLLLVSAGLFETVQRIQLDISTLLGLFYLGVVVSGFCFAANAWLLQRHGASQVSVFSFATPVCGVILGVLLRNDHLSIWLVLACVFVVAGIYLTNVGEPVRVTSGCGNT